ncbi:MAG: 5-nitroimidazole antibiotic resistance protein, partial [Clostridiales bacterium]|nr:5-nitroimidazole antibiotic resistance protein [Clostridiales bacterium]
MFRKMRRFAQSLSEEENIEILSRNTSGVLALSGDEGYPYALPMAYCYDNGRIIFHSASKGHKIDAVGNCDKASFCVIDRDDVFPEEYTTKYRSVIVFGKIR